MSENSEITLGEKEQQVLISPTTSFFLSSDDQASFLRSNGSTERSGDKFTKCRAGQILRRAWHANRVDADADLVSSSPRHGNTTV